MDPPIGSPRVVEFGRFRVLPHRRELLADDQPLEIGGRAFDVLLTLIEADGAVVTKDALMQRVWPGQIVEENNLQVQIAALRRALGADRDLVRTVARRGYQFVGTLHAIPAGVHPPAAEAAIRPPAALARTTNLPEHVSELIGRDMEVAEILDLASRNRIVTLTGIGGIGKTRLSLEVARRLASGVIDGVWLTEFAPLSDPELVPVTVAAALGLALPTGAASPLAVAAALRSKQVLLVLDNCEHVLDAAAQITEAVLHANPMARVIATSREPLGAEGEQVYRVPPLAVPTNSGQDGADALRYGAFRLFVERARAIEPSFVPDARTTAPIAAICRHLDGIPLALELAAARAAALGIDAVATRLGDRFRILTGGRRTAMPRHRTLRATLDWSYELLTRPERTVLRRLAVFPGSFRLDSATRIIADDEIGTPEIIDCIVSLTRKSLISADAGGSGVRHRLLETTRTYLLEKLAEYGEIDAVSRSHAAHYLHLLERAESEAETRPTEEWLADYGPSIDNVRAALDWAFSPAGDLSVAIALTISAVPLWLQLSLMEECRARVAHALDAARSGPGLEQQQLMQLYAALGASLMYTKGPVPETRAAWLRALDLAESLGDARCQLAAFWGLSFLHSINGEHPTELTFAQRFCSLANQMDPADARVGDRMMGTSLHYLGDQASARHHIERVLTYSAPPVERVRLYRFQFDQLSAARCILSHVLWVQGFPDRAVRTARDSVDGARVSGHALSVCNALAQGACPMAAFTGDLAAAERFAVELIEHSEQHGLGVWQIWGRCWSGVVLIRRGNLATGLSVLQTALEELQRTGFVLRLTGFLSVLAEGLGNAGQLAHGLATIDDALAHAERSHGHWCMPELLRVKGRLLHLQGGSEAAVAAEDQFLHALDWARRQGAFSWELRVIMNLAALWREQARWKDARELLATAYDHFTEGFETADLTTARALMDSLR